MKKCYMKDIKYTIFSARTFVIPLVYGSGTVIDVIDYVPVMLRSVIKLQFRSGSSTAKSYGFYGSATLQAARQWGAVIPSGSTHAEKGRIATRLWRSNSGKP
jgi:hypothetical protein